MLSGQNAKVSVWTTISAAGLAGAAGGFAGNPADVILVRMTGDLYRPANQRFNYKGAADGLLRITREEGIACLFRGIAPNMVRATLMNSSQLASYVLFLTQLRLFQGPAPVDRPLHAGLAAPLPGLLAPGGDSGNHHLLSGRRDSCAHDEHKGERKWVAAARQGTQK